MQQQVNKNHSSTFHGIMFSFRTFCDFFHISIQRLKENDYENTLFVQLETRMIALHCSVIISVHTK